eukprot:TRINITY_DN11815_c0_g1_i1.p1 TRINITY_DN11815_c0_g1~~TRINITY_DN11815_c0_g1_i1.p1  ORF type:complete len:425 (-),score=97.09 TRINITY_DN11815_c0_g1_i1:25-1299(-)
MNKMKGTTICVLLAMAISITMANQCKGKPNLLPVFEKEPTLVAKSETGKLFEAGFEEPKVKIAHLYGTPYQMGLAHGQLLKDEINEVVPLAEQWVEETIEEYLDSLPKFLADLIAEYGVPAALDATYFLTSSYIPPYFLEEMHGIADGSGMSYDRILRLAMLPELIKASCSMVGSWGPAIEKTGGNLYQLRALDWSTNGPFQQYPVVLVYHPSEGYGHDFSVLSWAGFVGALTGMSSAPFGICEKVWLHYNGTSSREGIPFTFLLRDILQFDVTMDDAYNRINNAARTCSIFVGLGNPEDHFRVVEYSYEHANAYDDRNFPEYKEHPRMKGLVYVDKHTQPSHNDCLSSILEEHYGSIDSKTMIEHVTAELQTGDMHIGIYDFAKNFFYVSNASPYSKKDGYTPAYERHFTRLNMTAMFSEPKE